MWLRRLLHADELEIHPVVLHEYHELEVFGAAVVSHYPEQHIFSELDIDFFPAADLLLGDHLVDKPERHVAADIVLHRHTKQDTKSRQLAGQLLAYLWPAVVGSKRSVAEWAHQQRYFPVNQQLQQQYPNLNANHSFGQRNLAF